MSANSDYVTGLLNTYEKKLEDVQRSFVTKKKN